MTAITIVFEVDDVPILDITQEESDLGAMLSYTGEQLKVQIGQKVQSLRCPEHDAAPHVTVTAQYSTLTDQMELHYHVDSCCQMLLLRTVQALNR
jgi:hypothetical protein